MCVVWKRKELHNWIGARVEKLLQLGLLSGCRSVTFKEESPLALVKALVTTKSCDTRLEMKNRYFSDMDLHTFMSGVYRDLPGQTLLLRCSIRLQMDTKNLSICFYTIPKIGFGFCFSTLHYIY